MGSRDVYNRVHEIRLRAEGMSDYLGEDILFLRDTILNQGIELCQADVRLQRALPRPMEDDGDYLPIGSVVLDNAGDAWRRQKGGKWGLVGGAYNRTDTLNPK